MKIDDCRLHQIHGGKSIKINGTEVKNVVKFKSIGDLTIYKGIWDTIMDTFIVLDKNGNVLYNKNFTCIMFPGGQDEAKKCLKSVEKWIENHHGQQNK